MIKQQPKIIDNWLYREQDGLRQFSRLVYLGKEAEPWSECTQAERERWEAEHAPQVEDIEPIE